LKNLKYCQVSPSGACKWKEAGEPRYKEEINQASQESEDMRHTERRIVKNYEELKILPENTPRVLQMEGRQTLNQRNEG